VPGRPDFAIGGTAARGGAFFFGFYFAATGLHAVHLVIGIALVATMWLRASRVNASRQAAAVEVTGLYWHFVDLVWIFLYPSLYLLGRAG
jgi:cytochrome c oxidase subunit 3